MMELPRVNPVGVTEVPDDFVRSPRRHSPLARLFAAALTAIFVAVVLGTGVASLASWCLTSDAGTPFPAGSTRAGVAVAQNAALLGVRGNGMTSRTLAIPVT